MYSFLVLGLVPGTNIQINFNTWLYALSAAFLSYGIYRRMHTLGSVSVVRQPLYASQLHNRR